MANTEMVTGQVAAAEPALLASTAAAPAVNVTEAPVETQTEAAAVESDSPIEAYGSRAEEPDMMMTGTNPQVYGGETEEATLVTEKPLFIDDAVVDDKEDDQTEDSEMIDEPDMDENVELDVDESDLGDEKINEFDPYDDYDEDDDWEEEYEENYDEGEFEDEDDGWTQWDDDDEDDLYEVDQDDDDNLDDEPRNHYDAAYVSLNLLMGTKLTYTSARETGRL